MLVLFATVLEEREEEEEEEKPSETQLVWDSSVSLERMLN